LTRNIFIIFQDKDNNYWFESDGKGVYHYDGKTIIHLSTKDGLSNNHIREIQQDKSETFSSIHLAVSANLTDKNLLH